MITWLRERDRNTKFFHVATTERRKRNIIDLLQNENGREVRKEQEIAQEIARYFENLFTSANP